MPSIPFRWPLPPALRFVYRAPSAPRVGSSARPTLSLTRQPGLLQRQTILGSRVAAVFAKPMVLAVETFLSHRGPAAPCAISSGTYPARTGAAAGDVPSTFSDLLDTGAATRRASKVAPAELLQNQLVQRRIRDRLRRQRVRLKLLEAFDLLSFQHPKSSRPPEWSVTYAHADLTVRISNLLPSLSDQRIDLPCFTTISSGVYHFFGVADPSFFMPEDIFKSDHFNGGGSLAAFAFFNRFRLDITSFSCGFRSRGLNRDETAAMTAHAIPTNTRMKRALSNCMKPYHLRTYTSLEQLIASLDSQTTLSRSVRSACSRNDLSVPYLSLVRDGDGDCAMTGHRPRSSYESDWLPYTKVTGRSAVRAAIGEALKTRSEVPQHLPHEMLTLLMQAQLTAPARSDSLS